MAYREKKRWRQKYKKWMSPELKGPSFREKMGNSGHKMEMEM